MNINEIIKFLKEYDGDSISLMEVCGTHTASISQNAIPYLISDKIRLISGPGCPVCVTVSSYIEALCNLAESGKTIITFGDLIRVPAKNRALKDVKALGSDVRMVYSPMDVLNLAKNEPEKEFVFAAVGFETTTPIYALLIDEIIKQDIKNLKLLTALKTMPNVINALCEKDNSIDGFIAPGHVSTIIGSSAFENLSKKLNKPFVISGFSDTEILSSIYALVKLKGQGRTLNLYKSAVPDNQNQKAYDIVSKYFEEYDAPWRGLGTVKSSGLVLKKEYLKYDAGSRELTDDSYNQGCICSEIITGKKSPNDCPLYKKICTPENPKGACMVSLEGTCFNYLVNDRN